MNMLNKDSINWYYVGGTALFFCVGFIWYAYMAQIIVIYFPRATQHIDECAQNVMQKKKVTLSVWHHERWNTENTELLWPALLNERIQHLLSAWLVMNEDEKTAQRAVNIESVVDDGSGTVYISFDRNPCDKQASTYTKLMWLEGLLKTIRDNESAVQQIYFLVHHQPLVDYHLDFSTAWSVTGFL